MQKYIKKCKKIENKQNNRQKCVKKYTVLQVINKLNIASRDKSI